MQYDEFIDRVQTYANLSTREEAITATNAFLSTLGEPLYRTERQNLAAQLPNELKDVLFEQQPPEQTRQEVRRYELEEFYNRFGARADVLYGDAVRLARTVATALQEAVTQGVIEDVIAQLPDGYEELFAQPPGQTYSGAE